MIEHSDMPVGSALPYHTHHRADECFYVLDGSVALVFDGEWLKAGPLLCTGRARSRMGSRRSANGRPGCL